MFAVHTDGLVFGVGKTEALAYADARLHGSEDETLLDACKIGDEAAAYVIRGGDCRGLALETDEDGEDIFTLRAAPGVG